MQPKYLVKVEPGANNNKFYRMIPCGDRFRVEYGRIGNPGFQTDNYPIGKWDSQLKSKIKKGYVDQTELVSEIIDSSRKKEYKEIDDSIISRIVKTLQSFARQSVEENYTISSAKVTQKMVNEAQFILDEISKSQTVESFNKYLVELFKTIPRKMKNVSDNLAKSISDFPEIVTKEQDLLDTMRSQVVQKVVLDDPSIDTPNKTILEHLGLVFERINYDDELLIKKNLGSISDRFKFAWKVKNIKHKKHLIHSLGLKIS